MYWRSSSDTQVHSCGSSLKYMSQKISQINPMAPVMMKDMRQPYSASSKATIGMPIAGPASAPERAKAVAKPRSWMVNHWRTTLLLDGMVAASPAPKASREASMVNRLTAPPVAIAASDQNEMANVLSFLAPHLSVK